MSVNSPPEVVTSEILTFLFFSLLYTGNARPFNNTHESYIGSATALPDYTTNGWLFVQLSMIV